jgi:hypothetical protein
MLPTLATVLGAECIRDGGSLGAFFVGSDSVEYWLFFKINLIDAAPGYREAKGYEAPVIIDRLVGTNISVSWDHAGALLNEMMPLFREEQHRTVAASMIELTKTAGRLTPGVIAQFECLQGPRKVYGPGDGTAKA